LVDGIPFTMPVASQDSPALMAAFSADAGKIAGLLPGDELHPLVLPNGRGVVLITVVDYTHTNIGKYVEFSIALGCTHGARPAPPLLPMLLQQRYGLGQYVWDLPVSSEISVKGGKGIWGMPKHQANLDFRIGERTVSSQYDLDGQLCMRIEIDRTRGWLPLKLGAANYCEFRGLLMKSTIYFGDHVGVGLGLRRSARMTIGDHPRMAPFRDLDISERPLLTVWLPHSGGVLDDHFEGWFVTEHEPPAVAPEGLESVVGLGLGQDWLEPPKADHRLDTPTR
jgi:hypothetical protein